MERSLTKLLVERERLLARSARERSVIAAASQRLETPAAIVDRVLDCGRFLRAHPIALAVVIASVALLRARSVLGMASRGFALWRIVRRLHWLVRTFGF